MHLPPSSSPACQGLTSSRVLNSHKAAQVCINVGDWSSSRQTSASVHLLELRLRTLGFTGHLEGRYRRNTLAINSFLDLLIFDTSTKAKHSFGTLRFAEHWVLLSPVLIMIDCRMSARVARGPSKEVSACSSLYTDATCTQLAHCLKEVCIYIDAVA